MRRHRLLADVRKVLALLVSPPQNEAGGAGFAAAAAAFAAVVAGRLVLGAGVHCEGVVAVAPAVVVVVAARGAARGGQVAAAAAAAAATIAVALQAPLAKGAEDVEESGLRGGRPTMGSPLVAGTGEMEQVKRLEQLILSLPERARSLPIIYRHSSAIPSL